MNGITRTHGLSPRAFRALRARDMAVIEELSPGVVLRFDEAGSVLSANPAAVLALGDRARHGTPVASLLPSMADIDYGRCIREGLAMVHETRVGQRHFEFLLRGAPALGVGYLHGTDVTSLRETEEELARSRGELEQLAHVAAHDLLEPVRMVGSYMQLLERRYGDRLDGDAREFISFAVDGANRMQTLIDSLLAYCRAGNRGQELAPADCGAALEDAVASLRRAVQESGARVTWEPLPLVMADRGQLTQLFQNLIGNAIKFRGGEPPRVHVGAERKGGEWLFSVRDNGIGIEPQYFDRIFRMFQRLHTREECPGTGIGLAICKRIVQRHGGDIWVTSEPGTGSTFHFTLREPPSS